MPKVSLVSGFLAQDQWSYRRPATDGSTLGTNHATRIWRERQVILSVHDLGQDDGAGIAFEGPWHLGLRFGFAMWKILSLMREWWLWHPPVGVWIGVLGLLGVIVPLLRDINRAGSREKALWTFLMFSLLLLEIKSVYQDRNEHDSEQAEARTREEDSFKEIAAGIQSSILDSDRNFAATMGKTKQVLENITGGNSFAIVTPQVWSGLVPIPLSIRNEGKQTLTGVTVTIRSARTFDLSNPQSIYEPEIINVGTLHPKELRLLKEKLTPVGGGLKAEDGLPVDRFELDIAAQNFTAQESLVFKKGTRLPWVFRYEITQRYIRAKRGQTITFGYKILDSKKTWLGEK